MADLRQRNFQQNHSLFALAPNFRIVKVGKADAKWTTDNLRTLESFVVASENMYPSIGRWFKEKVVPGLKTSERIAYVAYEGEATIASAILKLGARSKFCHLRIHQDFQDLDLGQMFFTQMTLEARHHAKEIHFTLPESLWCAKQHFFESFGFKSPDKAYHQYRSGDAELSCSAPLAAVWHCARERLPDLAAKFSPSGFSLDNRILISIKPKYAERIIAGTKLVEVRKRFSQRWLGCRAVLYGSHPLRSLVGEATISTISWGSPAQIWSTFGPRIGIERREFEEYAGSCSELSAIELGDVTPYAEPVGLAQLSHLTNTDLRPPQSFCKLKPERSDPWTAAVAVASLLHGGFGCFRVAETGTPGQRERSCTGQNNLAETRQ
jgi:predicted transcriptional regulator